MVLGVSHLGCWVVGKRQVKLSCRLLLWEEVGFFVCVYVRKFASLSSLSVFGSVVVGNLCLVSAYIYL